MDEAQGGAEQGLDPEGTVRGFREGQPLGLDILRVVIRDDHVDHALVEGLHHRLAVGLVAQGRREPAEGAVMADVILVQHEVVDRHPAGHR
jgi:hypothetical protein